MADKAELKIVLSTVDKWTAGINAFNKRIDELTRPTREFGKALKDLAEKSGFNAVIGGFRKVGGAVKDLIGQVLSIGGAVGGAVGVATAGVLHLVEEFDNLGDKAERLGVGVDFLAAMRFAAERSGAEVEELDNGLQAFMANVGAAKANKGSLFKFLSVVSPDLLKQIKAAKTGDQAFMRLADGMAALTDQEKKLALAEKSGVGAALVPLLSRGSKGLLELQGAHAALAGSLEAAASGAGEVDDSLKNLKASTQGVEAALVAGLAPALKDIIDKLSAWLVGHRDDVRQWAHDIGEKLPAAVESLVKWAGEAYDEVTTFIDGIGGWKVALLGVAAVMTGPLALAIASLGVALLATPFGQVLLALTPIVAAIAAIVAKTEAFEAVAQRLGFASKKRTPEQQFQSDMDAMMADGRRAAKAEADAKAALDANPAVQQARLLQDQHDAMLAIPPAAEDPKIKFLREGAAHDARMAALRAQIDQQAALHPGPQEAKVTVDFKNVPRGASVTTDPRSTADVNTNVGYLVGGGVW